MTDAPEFDAETVERCFRAVSSINCEEYSDDCRKTGPCPCMMAVMATLRASGLAEAQKEVERLRGEIEVHSTFDKNGHHAIIENYFDLGRELELAPGASVFDAVTTLAAENSKLREALEPFAKLEMPHQELDHWPAFGKRSGEGWPTVGDFRRAARVLAETGDNNG